MRSVSYTDVAATVRVLLAVTPMARRQTLKQLLREAAFADKFVRRLGKLHPKWGNGTLLDAAKRRRMAPELSFDDPEYCKCFSQVVLALSHRPRHEFM